MKRATNHGAEVGCAILAKTRSTHFEITLRLIKDKHSNESMSDASLSHRVATGRSLVIRDGNIKYE